jgi:hypothetical protein
VTPDTTDPIRQDLLRSLSVSAAMWNSYAMANPTEENCEIANVVIAVAVSAGQFMQMGRLDATGKVIPGPLMTAARTWRKAAARNARRIAGNPILSDDLTTQRRAVEHLVGQGDDRGARRTVGYLVTMHPDTLIRSHTPRISRNARWLSSLQDTPDDLRSLVADVSAAWAKCKRGTKWDGMNATLRRRALVQTLLKTLGMRKTNHLYAAQDAKAKRARKR